MWKAHYWMCLQLQYAICIITAATVFTLMCSLGRNFSNWNVLIDHVIDHVGWREDSNVKEQYFEPTLSLLVRTKFNASREKREIRDDYVKQGVSQYLAMWASKTGLSFSTVSVASRLRRKQSKKSLTEQVVSACPTRRRAWIIPDINKLENNNPKTSLEIRPGGMGFPFWGSGAISTKSASIFEISPPTLVWKVTMVSCSPAITFFTTWKTSLSEILNLFLLCARYEPQSARCVPAAM